MNMNLPQEYDDYDYIIRSAKDLPNSSGIVCPYVESLAQSDHHTVPFILNGLFFGLLNTSMEACRESAKSMVSAWDDFKDTPWGKELAHMYTGIRLAVESASGIRIMVTPQNVYQGFILLGVGFTLSIGDRFFPVITFTDLQATYTSATPHDAALTQILSLVNFDDDMQRQKVKKELTCLYDLGKGIREKGYSINDREKIAKLAQDVTFVSDRYLPITGDNIAKVFNTMNESFGEERFPLHHLALFENDRKRRLLSAFGATAPSFLIAGGRKMELSGNFSFNRVTKKGKSEVKVTRMHCVVVPLEKAFTDLDLMILHKHVVSPVGTPFASRASSRSLIREFDGTIGIEVLAALRKVTGTTVSNVPSTSNEKRKADEEAAAESSKKARAALDDF